MINKLENTNETLALAHGNQERVQVAYVTQEEKETKTAKELYYRWLSRLVILLTFLSLCFFAAASLVLFKLAPQVTVEPFLLITQDSSEEVVRYEPVTIDMPSSRQLMETFIKQYVILRNSLLTDTREMQSRWYPGGIIDYMSSEKVYDDFYKKEVEKDFEKTMQSKIVRDVQIDKIGKIGGENSRIWEVRFSTFELNPAFKDAKTGSMLLIRKRWRATITPIFVPERMFLARRLMNPLGFTVMAYSQDDEKI